MHKDKSDRIFYHRLKAVQVEHKPDKWEARHPYNWKKEWGPFLKYDADWDGAYFLDLIIYKLEKIYISLDVYSDEIRENLELRLATLRQTIDLGKKIQHHDYNVDSYQWSLKHCAHVINIYKAGEAYHKEPLHQIVKWRSTDPWVSEEPLDDFFKDKEIDEWAEANGYKRKDLTIAYSGEWDTPDNHKIWLKKMKDESKAEQKDIDTFFKLIAKHYQSWWW